jgi:hypothetical protein
MSALEADSPLTSGVLTSAADGLLRSAIAVTLGAEPHARADLLTRLLREIEDFMRTRPEERPWTCSMFTGTDGSRIFRGGIGHSIVIDPVGRMWRARSYEDFDTTYTITENACTIASLTPQYKDMRQYLVE